MTPHLAVEGMVAFGLNEGRVRANDFVVPDVQLKLTVYSSISPNESSFSYGTGLSYTLGHINALTFDWMQYWNEDGFKVKSFSVGAAFKF